MNTVELNFNALVAASTALLGAEKTNMLSELYVLLDNAEKIGEANGWKDGFAHGGIGEAQKEEIGRAHV